MDPALKLDRLAQLRAELDGGLSEAELLERERLDVKTWRESCAHWDAMLASEAESNRSVLTNRYNTAFNTTRRLLASKLKRAPALPVTPASAAPPPEPPSPPVSVSLSAIPPPPRPSSPPVAPPARSEYLEHPLERTVMAAPVGETTIGIDSVALLRHIMPFRQSNTVPSPSTPLPVDTSSTIELDPNSAELAAALPFLAALREKHQQMTTAASPPPARRFSLEEFAGLTAQVASAPHDAASIRARWLLDEASHRAESEHWQQEFARQPALSARYTELVKHYRAAYRGAK
jgi:hypothetical protein